jgi:ribosomal protein S18 acetylase RimI-like enzyme
MHSEKFFVKVFDSSSPVPDALLAQFYSIYQHAFSDGDRSFLQAIKREQSASFARHKPGLVLLLRNEAGSEKVVGGLRFVYSSASRSFYINMVSIDPNARGRGFARFLFAHAESELSKKIPEARFFVEETIAVRPVPGSSIIEDRAVTLARAKLWERLGFRRIQIPGKNIAVENNSDWDVRVKEIGIHPQPSTISKLQFAKLVLDFHRNPFIHGLGKEERKQQARQMLNRKKNRFLRKKPGLGGHHKK